MSTRDPMVVKVKDMLKEQLKEAHTTADRQLVALLCTTTLLARVIDELEDLGATLRHEKP